MLLVISATITVIGMVTFCISNNLLIMYVSMLCLFLYVLRKSNYATARINLMLNLFVITLCGDTNYMLYYFVIDFVVCCIICMMNHKPLHIYLKGSVMWLLVLMCGILGGFTNAVDLESHHVGILVYFLIFLMSLSSENICEMQRIKFRFIGSTFISSNIGILVLFFLNNSISDLLIQERATIRLLGESGIRSNTLGGIIVVHLVFLLYFSWNFQTDNNDVITNKEPFYSKVFRYIVIIGDIVILLFLQSRGCYVAIACIIVLSVILKIKEQKELSKNDIIKGTVSIVFIVLAMLSTQIMTFIESNVLRRFFREGDLSNGRYPLYQIALEMWNDHPLFGNGFSQFGSYGIESMDPHNFILAYLASIGLVGTLFLCIYLRNLIVGNANTHHKCLLFVVVAQIIHAFFEPVLTTSLPLSLFIVTSALLMSNKLGNFEDTKI